MSYLRHTIYILGSPFWIRSVILTNNIKLIQRTPTQMAVHGLDGRHYFQLFPLSLPKTHWPSQKLITSKDTKRTQCGTNNRTTFRNALEWPTIL